MTEPPLLPLSRFIGAKFSLSEADQENALDDDQAEFILEILSQADWSDPVCVFGEYIIRSHEGWSGGGDMGLFHGGDLVGFYEGLNLWVHASHRGRGLAIPLILTAARLRGGSVLPEGVESQKYSPAGLLAHSTAHLQTLLCALRRNEPIPQDVLREYNLHHQNELVQMFGAEILKNLKCCDYAAPGAGGEGNAQEKPV